MRAHLLAASIAAIIALSAVAAALPRSEVAYAEVLLYDGKKWVSRYYLVKGGVLTFRAVGARVAVVRLDTSSMMRPYAAFVDGRPYVPGRGAGMLWHSYTLVLDGGVHTVTVKFELSPPIYPFTGIFAPLPDKEAGGETKVRVPPLPGFGRAGARVTVIVPGPEELGRVIDKPFFVYNESVVTVVGKQFRAYQLIVPYANFTIKPPFIYASYTPLYYVESRRSVVVPPYKFRAAYANYPEPISVEGGGPNLVAADPPHVYFGMINASSASFETRMHRVNLLVSEAEACGGKRLSYKVILPPGGKQVDTHVFDLAENTSITVRFYYGSVAVLDYVIDTPPPSLIVNPPFYRLKLLVYDSRGHPLYRARYVLYNVGSPAASGQVVNGSAEICPLPEGFYTVAVYVADRLVGKRSFTLESDAEIPVVTETTTVKVRVVRLNAGGFLPSFNVTLSGGGLAYNATASGGVAEVSGVPYGKYNVTVSLLGAVLYRGQVEVTPANSEFTYALPVYRLHVKVLTALDQPVSGARVTVKGPVSVSGVTDEEGRVDLGYLPRGDYTVYVEGAGSVRVALRGDTYRVVKTDILFFAEGRPVRTWHAAAAAVVLLLALVYVASRRGRRGRVVEV